MYRPKLRQSRFIGLLLAGIAMAGCEHPQIFAPAGTEDRPNSQNASALISVQITGGFAGLNQDLTIRQDGEIALKDRFPFGQTRTDVLTQAELNHVNSAFLNQRFLALGSEYLTPNGIDFIYYKMAYNSNGIHKTVLADYHAAPAALREIIDLLNEQVTALQQNGLSLRLSTSADTLRLGKTMTLAMHVQNSSAQNMELTFYGGQRFGFVAYRPHEIAAPNAQQNVLVAWQWQGNQVFDPAATSQRLAAGSELILSTEWDGTDATGKRIAGDVWVVGQLTAAPGGATTASHIFIADDE